MTLGNDDPVLARTTHRATFLRGSGVSDPPRRIANRYDYRDYQPMQAEVCRAVPAPAVDCAQPQSADDELARLRLRIERNEAKYPPGFLLNSAQGSD